MAKAGSSGDQGKLGGGIVGSGDGNPGTAVGTGTTAEGTGATPGSPGFAGSVTLGSPPVD